MLLSKRGSSELNVSHVARIFECMQNSIEPHCDTQFGPVIVQIWKTMIDHIQNSSALCIACENIPCLGYGTQIFFSGSIKIFHIHSMKNDWFMSLSEINFKTISYMYMYNQSCRCQSQILSIWSVSDGFSSLVVNWYGQDSSTCRKWSPPSSTTLTPPTSPSTPILIFYRIHTNSYLTNVQSHIYSVCLLFPTWKCNWPTVSDILTQF